MRVWRIATDTPDYLAGEFAGSGAKLTGGRWNRPGNAVLYCAENPSLACLETIVQLGAGGLPLKRYLVAIDIADRHWAAREERRAEDLPVGWDALPPGKLSLDYGDRWLAQKRSLVLAVPSAIVPEDRVVLINPLHPDAASVKATKLRRWLYDERVKGATVAKSTVATEKG